MAKDVLSLGRLLSMLSPSDKRSAADQLRRMAADLERQADEDAARKQALDRGKRFRASLRDNIHRVSRMLVNRMSADQIAAACPDFDEGQVAALIAKATPQARRMAQDERNREIGRLARKLTNSELAARFGLSEVHISRIIGQQYRKPKNHPS